MRRAIYALMGYFACSGFAALLASNHQISGREFFRVPELVPIGDRVIGAIPLRHPVTPGAKHPIEGAARDRQIGAVLGAEDLLDQRIDRRV